VVLPYDEATQSGIIPIAYSFRKPVIATRVGSIPEVIDESTGILISPKNSEELSKAILSMFHKDLKEMGENGYEKMKEIMDWDKIAEEIYKKAYNGK
jgi:glycosyltransferase involved in cell wall biosynthesis